MTEMQTEQQTYTALHREWIYGFMRFGPWEVIDWAAFQSVDEFWKLFEISPLPSQLFQTKSGPREAFLGTEENKENLRSILIYHVPLSWNNRQSKYIYSFEMKDMEDDDMNNLWEECILKTIGETLGESVNGIRILDRSKKKDQCSKFRIEIWTKCAENRVQEYVDTYGGECQEIN